MEEIATKIVAGEHRLTMLLMGHWQELRDGRRAPLVRAFKTAVPLDLLADCFILLPAETPDRRRLHDIGERIARVSGIAVTSLMLSEVPGETLIGVASKWLVRTLELGAPVVDEGEFEDRHGARILYRATLLPLANQQDEIIQVLGGARGKAAAEDS
ncbi:MAG: PAS domain-containing protein [Proteobacteria bacterium]|nr:PAS domain-containing protein [Pseudomonadota bacterium]